MSWSIYDTLKNDHEFISNENIKFSLLVRDPDQSILSIYSKDNQQTQLGTQMVLYNVDKEFFLTLYHLVNW